MNAVDVLAIMSNAEDMLGGFNDADHAEDGEAPIIAPLLVEMRKARAAVAGLIEAATAGSIMDASGREALWFGQDKAERLRAALAQVKGDLA